MIEARGQQHDALEAIGDRFDQRILLLALAAGFPAALVSLVLLWTGDYTARVQWTLTVLIVGIWLGCSFAARHRVVLPLQTLANLLAAEESPLLIAWHVRLLLTTDAKEEAILWFAKLERWEPASPRTQELKQLILKSS